MQEDENERPDDDVESEECAEKEEKRSYYYDDAHGYEEFDPANENEVDDDEEDQLTNVS